MCETGAGLAEAILTNENGAQLQNVTDKEPLAIPSSPKASNEWRYTGSRFQGPNRALSFAESKTSEEHVELSRKHPPPMENGAHILSDDVRGTIRFITERGTGDIKVF